MALDLKPVQVRLPDDAYEALKLLADLEDKDMGEKAREILTRSLLGDVHAARVIAERLSRAAISGRLRKGGET